MASNFRALRGQPERAGLYHLSASGETSWHGYAQHVIAHARAHRPQLSLKVKEVKAVPSSAFQSAARRPHNSRLDCARIQSAFDLRVPAWQQGVDRMLTEIL